MINKLPLCLLLIVGPYYIQTQDIINDKRNIVEDDPSFLLRDTLLQISVEKDTITAGNSKCKQGDKCGYHNGASYSWCWTDDGSWDYCCIGECKIANLKDRLVCDVGNGNVNCGNPGNRTITGASCLPSHPCGAHGQDNFHHTYYWCYIDENENWDRCCNPLDKCHNKNDGYSSWCYTGLLMSGVQWRYCEP